MVHRRRKVPAQHFKQLPPYNPFTGEYAQLGDKADLTRVAMIQIAEEDTHDNYVVCRGFDPEAKKFFNAINVGKPYGVRGETGTYTVGEVYIAVKPLTRIGETPGMAETSDGHPADLNEEVGILVDDDDNPIAWILIDDGSGKGGTATMIQCTANGSVSESDATIDVNNVVVMQPVGGTLPGGGISEINNTHDWELDDGALIEAVWNDAEDRWETIQADCPA